ncbi:MAG: hypothetical protein NT051_03980 [Candidatus Micrarchaeota archaeon]|nr:hypothetical protein [Candidatus Micrarchaeota archaeon]
MAIKQRMGNSAMHLGNAQGEVKTVLPGSIAREMFRHKDIAELRTAMNSLLAFSGDGAYRDVSYDGRDDRQVCKWRITMVDEKYPGQTLVSMQVEQLLRAMDNGPMPKRMFAYVGIAETGEFRVTYGFGEQGEYTRLADFAKTAKALGGAIKNLISEFAKEAGLTLVDKGKN